MAEVWRNLQVVRLVTIRVPDREKMGYVYLLHLVSFIRHVAALILAGVSAVPASYKPIQCLEATARCIVILYRIDASLFVAVCCVIKALTHVR